MSPTEPLVKIQLRYPDEPTFVTRFAPNVTRGGIFLASRKPKSVGEVIRFEVALATGPALLRGTGRVTWVREFNPNEPHRAHGMGVQFISVDPECRPLLDTLLAQKGATPPPTPVGGIPAVARQADPLPSLMPSPATVLGQAQPDDDLDGAINDAGLRRALDRARMLAGRTELESLLAPDDDEAPTLHRALAELPRMVSGRRTSANIRVLPEASPPDSRGAGGDEGD